MSLQRLSLCFLAIALVVSATGCFDAGSGTADSVFRGGPILTMDPATPRAEAVAVSGDRIVAVGSAAEISDWIGPETRVVELAGRTLIPGFVDSHSHLYLDGQTGFTFVDVRPPPIGAFDTVASIQEALRARDADTPSGEWIIATGYDDTLLEERRHLTRHDLDAVSATRPIVVMHVSLHIAAVNSAALAYAGIDASTPQPPGGVIRKDPETGEPNGILEEGSALAPFFALLGDAPIDVGLEALGRGVSKYVRQGVTTAQDGAADIGTLQLLIQMDVEERLPIRVVAFPRADLALKMLAGDIAINVSASEYLHLGAVKIVSDGSIQGYTGYLGAPYHVPPGDDSGYRGYPAMPAEQLAELVNRLYAGGFQVAIHTNGDAAIDDALAAFEQAQAAHPRDDDRPIFIHAQMARDDQLKRMAALGAIPSFFTLHTYYWGDRHRDRFMGPERAAHMSPMQSAIRENVRFTIHTDAPVVPMEPLRLLWSAVNRESTSGEIIGADERISPEQALRALTLDAAYAYFLEDEIGSIETGKLADLVILSDDPTTVDPGAIDEIQVVRTIVGGQTLFAR